MSLHGLSRQERLKKSTDIAELFNSGSSLFTFPLNLKYQRRTNDTVHPVAFAVTVSKRKFKRAVDRNRIKRKIREYYRLNKAPLIAYCQKNKLSLNIMFIYSHSDLEGLEKTEASLITLLKKLIDALEND